MAGQIARLAAVTNGGISLPEKHRIGEKSMTKIQAETFVLDDIAQGRIDDKKLFAFLDAYGLYWHYCHAKGRMDEHVLKNAERNAIAYAKNKELCLEFGEMTYSLKTADQVNLESS